MQPLSVRTSNSYLDTDTAVAINSVAQQQKVVYCLKIRVRQEDGENQRKSEGQNEELGITGFYEYVMFTSITFAALNTRRGISFSKRSSCIRLIGPETLTAATTSSF